MKVERRKKRSEFKDVAAGCYLEAAMVRHQLEQFVLADESGLLVAAPKHTDAAEELAVVAAHRAAGAASRRSFVPSCAFGAPMHVAEVLVGQQRCVLAAVGDEQPDMQAARQTMQRIMG